MSVHFPQTEAQTIQNTYAKSFGDRIPQDVWQSACERIE
jgi:hypothetical protein